MKYKIVIVALLAGVTASAPVFAKSPVKNSTKASGSCPSNLPEGGCDEYTEGYLNGVADRGVGEANVFSKEGSSDAYKAGYEKGWKSGRNWD